MPSIVDDAEVVVFASLRGVGGFLRGARKKGNCREDNTRTLLIGSRSFGYGSIMVSPPLDMARDTMMSFAKLGSGLQDESRSCVDC